MSAPDLSLATGLSAHVDTTGFLLGLRDAGRRRGRLSRRAICRDLAVALLDACGCPHRSLKESDIGLAACCALRFTGRPLNRLAANGKAADSSTGRNLLNNEFDDHPNCGGPHPKWPPRQLCKKWESRVVEGSNVVPKGHIAVHVSVRAKDANKFVRAIASVRAPEVCRSVVSSGGYLSSARRHGLNRGKPKSVLLDIIESDFEKPVRFVSRMLGDTKRPRFSNGFGRIAPVGPVSLYPKVGGDRSKEQCQPSSNIGQHGLRQPSPPDIHFDSIGSVATSDVAHPAAQDLSRAPRVALSSGGAA
jgi:hypothetical protein